MLNKNDLLKNLEKERYGTVKSLLIVTEDLIEEYSKSYPEEPSSLTIELSKNLERTLYDDSDSFQDLAQVLKNIGIQCQNVQAQGNILTIKIKD